MRRLRVLIWTTALCVLAAPAAAASRADWDACKGDDPDASIAACTRIIQGRGETAKNFAIARRYRGLAYQRKADLDRAIADYSEAIRLDPKYADAYYGRGLTYRNKGDLEVAIADYSEAIRLDPKLASAYNNRGNAYRDKGDPDRAIADFNEAIRLAPEFEAVYPDTIVRRLAHFNRGNAYAAKGDLDRATADFSEVIRLDPNSADAYYRRAAAYAAKGDVARAVADLSEVVRLAPEVATLRNGGANYTSCKGTTRAPSPTIRKRSGSIPSSQPPTTTGAPRTASRAI
jgi:tetratricopeptide (TPR) repeat protein